MKVIDVKTITAAATIPEWIDAMRKAMLFSLGHEYVMPPRMHIDYGEASFLLMPCITDEYWATKLVSYSPGNTRINLPSIYGTIVLNRTTSGEPLAVMEGSKITALRTAAVSSLGIIYLAPENAATLGIVGTGTQGIQQARFACSVRQIQQITIYDRSEKSISGLINEFGSEFRDIKIKVAENSNEVCKESEIVITASNSKDPVFPNKPELFKGKTFIAIGSYKPDSREYPDVFFSDIDQVFVDTVHAGKESGDLIHPLRTNLISDKIIYSLGSLIAGEISLSAGRTRFFKTVGSAIYDLYAAKLVYEKTI